VGEHAVCSAQEVRLVLGQRGVRIAEERVLSALVALARDGKVKRTDLRSQRDISRAGARWLWSAV
jgi:hypothetical protein